MNTEDNWQPVVFAHDCETCPDCEDLLCPRCGIHYVDCDCPGPTQDDLYDYMMIGGVMHAKRLPERG
jgi:hypothetical protein